MAHNQCVFDVFYKIKHDKAINPYTTRNGKSSSHYFSLKHKSQRFTKILNSHKKATMEHRMIKYDKLLDAPKLFDQFMANPSQYKLVLSRYPQLFENIFILITNYFTYGQHDDDTNKLDLAIYVFRMFTLLQAIPSSKYHTIIYSNINIMQSIRHILHLLPQKQFWSIFKYDNIYFMDTYPALLINIVQTIMANGNGVKYTKLTCNITKKPVFRRKIDRIICELIDNFDYPESKSLDTLTKIKQSKEIQLSLIKCGYSKCSRRYYQNACRFKACKGCKMVWYCCRLHQKISWNLENHKEDCNDSRAFFKTYYQLIS